MAAIPELSGNRVVKSLAEAAMPRRARGVLEHVLQEAKADLTRQLQTILQETEVALSRPPESGAREEKLEALQFAALRNLRQSQRGFIERYLVDVEASLAGLYGARTSYRLDEKLASSPGEMRLVDDDAMSEQAMLNTVASRIESRNSLGLQLIGQRFGVLAAAPAFDAEHAPLGPYALCGALYRACNGLELPPHAIVELFRQYEKVMIALYSTLLEALNNRMARDGILPYLSFVPVRARGAAPGAQPSNAGGASAQGAQPRAADGPAVASAGSSLGASPLGRANFGQNAPGGGLPPAHQATPHAEAASATGGPATGAKADLGTGFARLQNLLKRRRVLLAKLRPAGQDDRVREPLRRDEVLAALQRLRSTAARADGIAEYRQVMLAQARQMHGHGVSLSDADGDTFELLSLFLTQLQRDLRKGSAGETLVERLRLPLLQLALRDHRFFVDASHPARLMLAAVSVAGARWLAEDDLDPQWLGLLQRAVATVQQDAEGAFDSFVDANQTLQSGLQALARKSEMAERRQVEAARGREKLEVARQRAAAEMARLLHGRSLPRFQAILMEQAWTDVLSLTHLRSGEQSEAWRDVLDTTATIIDASTGASSARASDPALVARVRASLEQVGYHGEDAAAIARQLANGPAEDADLASRTELLVQLRARARLGEGNAPTPGTELPARTPAEDAAFERLRALQEPVWVEFDEDADALTLRRRLAWVSQRTGQTLVVNRRGLRALSEDLDLLARKLAAARMRLLDEDVSPAEAAWDATMASLQRIAESENQAEGG